MNVTRSPWLLDRLPVGSNALPIARAALVSFDVPGIPLCHRDPSRRLCAAVARNLTADNRKLRPWRDAVIWHVRQALAGRPMVIGLVEIELVIRLPRPKSHFGGFGLQPSAPRWPAVRPDVDKILRGVSTRSPRRGSGATTTRSCAAASWVLVLGIGSDELGLVEAERVNPADTIGGIDQRLAELPH
ncbi:MAG: hypothetical protein ACREQM_18235, partial [Candidatus Dormibacteraceae bacterium]